MSLSAGYHRLDATACLDSARGQLIVAAAQGRRGAAVVLGWRHRVFIGGSPSPLLESSPNPTWEKATPNRRPPSAKLIDATPYFTVTVKHSLVRTVPSVPTTRKLTSNFAPSTNRGKAGGPRRTS